MARLPACGVIMAGGASSRMGQNKALLPFQGEPLVSRVARQMTGWFEQVVLVTNTPEEYAFLGLPMVSDRIPGLGPLGGIEAGLGASRYPLAFFAAVDMPFLNGDLVRYLVSLGEAADVVVPMVNGHPEPMHAVYSTTCLPVIRSHLDAGIYQIRRFFPLVRVREVGLAEIQRFGDPERLFFNCNTPEEWERALRLAGEATAE